jgi:hypothetical protein
MKRFIVLLRSEARRLVRDPFLVLMALVPFLAGGALRVAWTVAAPLVRERLGMDIAPFAPLAAAVLLQMPPFMLAMCFGFQCLEDRDSGLFLPLEASPRGTGGYLSMRTALCSILSLGESAVMPALFGAKVPSLGAGLVGSLLLPAVLMYVLGVVPRNKVEGLTVGKALSAIDAGAALAFFPLGPWTLAAVLLPTYAPARAALGRGGEAWIWAGIALVQQALLIALFLRLFMRQMRRGMA